LLADRREGSATRPGLDPRNQTRRFSDFGSPRRLKDPSNQPKWSRSVDNPAFPQAAKRLYKMVGAALENSPWLVGTEFTLADIAYVPYITRLDHPSRAS
jgi:glutathione S-transferase